MWHLLKKYMEGGAVPAAPARTSPATIEMVMDSVEGLAKEVKVFVGTAAEVEKRVKALEDHDVAIIEENKKRDDWIRKVEGRVAAVREGSSGATSDMIAAIPQRHRVCVHLHERHGKKPAEAILETAYDTWMKNALLLENPKITEQHAALRKELEAIGHALGEDSDAAKAFRDLQKHAVSGTSLAAGGALIPAPLEAELLRVAQDSGVGRGLARKVPMVSVQHIFPSLANNVQIFLVAETGAGTESNPTFGQSILKAVKFMGLGAISREELADAAIGVADLMRTLYGEQLGLMEDRLIFEGDGIGLNPVGIVADADVKEVQATISGSPTNGGPVAYDDIVDVMWKGRKRVTRRGAAWVGPPNMVRDLLKLKDTQNRPIFITGIAGLETVFAPGQDGNSPDGILQGKPFYATDEIKIDRTVGTATNCGNAYFGPWSNSYMLGDLLGIQWGTSEHVHWTTDLISVRLIKRTAFLVALGANFTKYTGMKVG